MLKSRKIQKAVSSFLFFMYTIELFASPLVVDPKTKYNTSLDTSATGVPIVNIATPNRRGVSVNEFVEYNIGKEGQVLNNADNVGRSHLAGLMNANPNLGAHQAASLVVLQVNGSNRSQIEGYLEALSREKINVLLSNEQGIHINGGGTIGIERFTATTGKVKLKDGDFVGIDIEKGNIAIGSKGLDVSNANYVELISKTLELTGNLVTNEDLQVITGSNKITQDGNIEKMESSTPGGVAIDASQLGGMYAGQIKIISTDKGAGVNSEAFIVSKNKRLEITVDGKVTINKVQGKGINIKAKDYEQKGLAQSDLDINIKANNIKLSGDGTQAQKRIILDGNVNNQSSIYTKENLYTKDLKNTSDIQVKKDIRIDGKLVSSGNIQANEKISIVSNTENTGNVSTADSFTAKDTRTTGKLVAKNNIDVKNLTNDGIVATEAKLNIAGALKNTNNIKALDSINIVSNVENIGDILTNSTFTAKNVKTTKKLLAKDSIHVSNLENDGELATNGSLRIDGKLENKGNIQTNNKITVASLANNSGKIISNSTFTAKDTKNTNSLVASSDITVSNLDNSGTFVSNKKLVVDGDLKNEKLVQAKENITVSKNVDNTGDILTDGKFISKDVKNTKSLIAKDKIDIENLVNDGLVATDSSLNVKGKLTNTKDIKVNKEINVALSANNSGEIGTNSFFSAKDTVNTNKLIAVDKISISNLINSGYLATNSTLTVDGTLKNTKKIIAKDDIKTGSLKNTDIVATDGSLKVAGNLNNSGNISAIKEIKIDENTNNTGTILTNSSFSTKDIKTTNKLVAVGEINTKNLVNEGDLATKATLNVDGTLENKKKIQAVDHITVSSHVQNDGTILTDANFSSKDIVNTKTFIAKENISSKTLENSGVFSAGKDLTVKGSVNNSKTIEATNIDITGENLVNSSNIKADTISAAVKTAKNDGDILALKEVTLHAKKLDNTKKIAALQNITANNTALTNSGEIISNKKIELNNSKITNTNKILSNTIEMKNASNFNNTGTISGTDVTLTSEKDINLVANLHGENSLIIEGKDIVNDGKTTGKNLISIKSNDFTNKKELSSKDLKIDAGGDIVNENILSAKEVTMKAKNLTNHDLIAAENDANITVKNKVTNTENSSIYAGNKLNIKTSDILNDSGEMLGMDVKLEANRITNHIGTLQTLNNMHIKAGKFENIGKVEDLDNYESYYETWDGQIIEANQIRNWKVYIPKSSSKSGSGSSGSTIRRRQRKAYNEISEKMKKDKYASLLFPKYDKLMRAYLGNRGEYTEKTGSARIQTVPLKEKLRSLGKTTHAKVLAGKNIVIEKNRNSHNEVINKNGIISAGNTVKIDANTVENLVSVGNEKIKVKTGQETMFIKFERKKRKLRPDRIRMNATYTRDFANDYITKKVPKLDENGKQIYRTRINGRKIPVYESVTEYIGRYAYVIGQPSVIEGKNVIIDNASFVRQGIEEANGYLKSGKDVNIQNFTSKNFNTGLSHANQEVNLNLSKTDPHTINVRNPLENIGNNLENNLEFNSQLHNYDDIEIYNNLSSLNNILKSGKMDTVPNLPSSLFVKNLEPTGKYVMETRLKHIVLSNYYGSDYFLKKIGYEEKWDRVKRLGDAFYENQLIERTLVEKLGTRFLNGKAISMKEFIDNASSEAEKLNLSIGKAPTKEQISKLSKDIVWYEYQDVSGIKVLSPKVYLSKNTLANLKADGRSKIEGRELTSIKAKVLDNTALIGNKGRTYIEVESIVNRSIGNQIAEIKGEKTSLVADSDIFNIGSKISATEELNLITKNGEILNRSTITETDYNYGDLNRTRHTELENIAEISSNNKLNIFADKYTSIAGKTSAKDLNISVKEDVNISSQKLSGEQKFGKDRDNFNSYAFESNIDSNVNVENMSVTAKNMNIEGSAVIAQNANLAVNQLNIDSNVDKIDTESRSKSKGFLSSRSKKEIQHSEKNAAGTLYVENKGVINGDVNVVGSNLVLGKDSYIGGKLTTDSKAIYSKYILEEKKKGFSSNFSASGFSLSYGKSKFSYDEKDKTNIQSNVILGDGTQLQKGANITATNLQHGDIHIQGGDVIYGARKDEKDITTKSKSSSFGISFHISSPALERAKQARDAVKQVGDGDSIGGLVNIGNAVTGTVAGLAGNIRNQKGEQATLQDIKNGTISSNHQFYLQAGVSAGYNRSKQESNSYQESAVVSHITGLDKNATITYKDIQNVNYLGTQANNTTFVYNNVDNIRKEAVELRNTSSSKGSASGIGVSAGLFDKNASLSLNVSASKNKQNTEETRFQYGKFQNVNEVHNNTGTMILSGFHQEGGSVTGEIEKVEIASLQNTSTTKGNSKGASLGIPLTGGIPTGSVSFSKTTGDRAFVDKQSSFVIGEDSDLRIGKLENTAAILGTQGNGKIHIDHYTGKNVENHEDLTTKGGSIGTGGVGIQYSDAEKEGITRNTVVGNVEIASASGESINTDLEKANEITKDSSTSTNVYVEKQLIDAVTKPEEFKEKIEVSKIEVGSLKGTVTKTIENTMVGDKSQDKGDPESRTLKEIKESVIRAQTAPEMDLIAKEDFSSKDAFKKLGIEAVEKFDINSSDLPEGVKERKEKLHTENKELVAFYDETTNKIFISKDIEDKTEIRALIAREWKISEDLKNKKGKSNDKGELRATVAGEIAYEEIKSRAKKGEVNEFNISQLEDAVMDNDTVVSADKYGEIKEGLVNISLAGLKYSSATSDINDNSNKLDEKTKTALKKEAEKFSEEIYENVNYMKDGWNRLEYLENELPSLEKAIEKEQDPLRKNLLERRKDYLRREKSTLSNLKEAGKGFGEAVVVTTIGAVGIAAAPITTTVIVGGTVIASVLNNKEAPKIEITSAQQIHLQNVAPEFYRAYKDKFTIKNSITLGTDDKNYSLKDIYYGKEFDNPQLLSMAKEFYSNAKTPDEKLSREIGNIVGGAVASKAVSGVANSVKANKISNKKSTLVLTDEAKQYSVEPNFDFDHVIGGDVSKNGRRVTGGHSLTRGDVRISEIIVEADTNGVYKAKVEIFNPKTQNWERKKADTTMFPKNWDENKIKEEIKSAWNSSDFWIENDELGKSWYGTSKSGIEIKGFINKDKTTAFPIHKGEIK